MSQHTEDLPDPRPDADDLPDGSNSDASEGQDGADTASGGPADDDSDSENHG